ncbi:hypothetical protein B7C51_06915 [Paenibacillus larvae subsp. pulvifaciens]|uniref:Transmembrane protein n=1 Tax=Paenibacillus larvae subsp. pulvifaciens TaxID=1477 RepID=A0A1V0UQS1_9BACL|nr:hypothetical protein [Paenibacillus larvae]ARF67619.1 hypothetical protein B7C51_06915 [Paenibacillus larvae subsp. pulvifaciens]
MSTYNEALKETVETIQKKMERVSQLLKDFRVPQIPPVHVAIPPEVFEQLKSFAARMEEVRCRISQILSTTSSSWSELASRLSNLRELKAFQEPIPEEIVPEYENLSSAVERAEILIENVNVTVNINVVKEEKPKRKITWFEAVALFLAAASVASSLYSNIQNAKTKPYVTCM